MSESFAELFEESLQATQMNVGSIMNGTVVDIRDGFVTVAAGLKSEGVIPDSQFMNEAGELEVKVGDEIEIVLEAIEDGWGETRLSRDKAKRAKAWIVLEAAHEAEEIITGVITGKVKGGFTVELGDIRAFLPGSPVDVRPVRDTAYLEGKELELKLSSLIKNVITLLYLVVLLLNLNTAQSVKNYWAAWKKASLLKVLLKILLITAHSLTWVVSMVCYISLIWHGNALNILLRLLKWVLKSKLLFLNLIKNVIAYLLVLSKWVKIHGQQSHAVTLKVHA